MKTQAEELAIQLVAQLGVERAQKLVAAATGSIRFISENHPGVPVDAALAVALRLAFSPPEKTTADTAGRN